MSAIVEIFLLSDPFQIVGTVIMLVLIFVVYYKSFAITFNKSKCDKSVDISFFYFSVFSKTNFSISFSCITLCQYAPF